MGSLLLETHSMRPTALIEKAAMIYSQIGAQGGRIKQDISDNQLRELAARFKVTPRKDFL